MGNVNGYEYRSTSHRWAASTCCRSAPTAARSRVSVAATRSKSSAPGLGRRGMQTRTRRIAAVVAKLEG
jgi:hypothetical protein